MQSDSLIKKLNFLTAAILFASANLFAQKKVANYSFGTPGTNSYEHFDFWTEDGKRTGINYVYGAERKEVKLIYLGKDRMEGIACFKVEFPNNYVLYIIPKGLQLKVTDAGNSYNRVFSWEYEGPVNGIGTYCDVCAEDDEEAMQLIKTVYFQ
jgi:hypothetical protein